MPINPTDTHFVDDYKKLKKSVRNVTNTRQPFRSDWFVLNPVDYSYNADNVLNVANIDPRTIFQIGDKVRLTQSATTKYFYVIDVTATTLSINGGSDYTYTNNAIDDLAFSKNVFPIGFPGFFNYSPTFTEDSTTTSEVSHTPSATDYFIYTMDGRNVRILANFNGDVANERSILLVTYPFLLQRSFGTVSKFVSSSIGQYSDLNNNIDTLYTVRHGIGIFNNRFIIDGESAITAEGDFLIGGNISKDYDIYLDFDYIY